MSRGSQIGTRNHGNPCKNNNTPSIVKIQKLELNVCTDERYADFDPDSDIDSGLHPDPNFGIDL